MAVLINQESIQSGRTADFPRYDFRDMRGLSADSVNPNQNTGGSNSTPPPTVGIIRPRGKK